MKSKFTFYPNEKFFIHGRIIAKRQEKAKESVKNIINENKKLSWQERERSYDDAILIFSMATPNSSSIPDDPDTTRGVLSWDVRRTWWLTAQVAEKAWAAWVAEASAWAAWATWARAQIVGNILSESTPQFLALLREVREIDEKIKNLLHGRDEQSRNMWMLKLAWTEPGIIELTENQVLAPEVEIWKIAERILDLDAMIGEAAYRKLKALLIECIPELFSLIFAHSRKIQLRLNYADSGVKEWVDMYRRGWDKLEEVKGNLRNNITKMDMELLRSIIARMECFKAYNLLLSLEESQQLLPAVEDLFLRKIFQEISDLCLKTHWSRGISALAMPW